MMIRRWKDKSIEFSKIEAIEAELLKQVPTAGDPEGEEKAEGRLYPSPMSQETPGMVKDWEEFVRPELRHLFLSARKVVEEDLAAMTRRPGKISHLVVPLIHAESWLNALNQARLVLATKYDFTEAELSFNQTPKTFSRRDLVLLQINFYAAVQERLIEILEEGTPRKR
jgi:Domain of unknown function (DUF2017)